MSSAIKVLVRPRPLSADDAKKEKWAPGLEIHGRRITLGTKSYDPDVCLSTSATQEDTFEHCLPIIDAVKDGCNGTIMVYGQTGTGKTYTMLGSESDTSGIAYRAIHELIGYAKARTIDAAECVVSVSLAVLEIYNEKITDMLAARPQDAEVTLIAGLPRSTTSVALSSMDEARSIVHRCLSNRHVASTAMNDRSSRSHVILMLDVNTIVGDQADVAHLFLVDLAGSENVKRSNVSGQALKEACAINTSLMALRNVILTLSQVSDAAATRPHVPYRDSRLTELLQDSIGGTARTMLIACVSVSNKDVEETRSTLEYASKARSIRNLANTARDKLVVKCRGLEVELQRAKNKLQEKLNERGGYWVTKEEHDDIQTLRDELDTTRTQLQQKCEDMQKITTRSQATLGQIGMWQDELKETQRKLRDVQSAYANSIAEFARTASDLQSQVAGCCNLAEAAAQRDMDRVRRDATAAAAVLTDPNFVGGAEQALSLMFEEVHTHAVGSVTKLLAIVREQSEKTQQYLTAERDDVMHQMEVLQQETILRFNGIKSAMARCHTDVAAQAQLTSDLSTTLLRGMAGGSSGGAAKDVLPPLRSLMADAHRVATAGCDDLTVSDDLRAALLGAKRATMKVPREAVLAALKGLPAVDASAVPQSVGQSTSIAAAPSSPAATPIRGGPPLAPPSVAPPATSPVPATSVPAAPTSSTSSSAYSTLPSYTAAPPRALVARDSSNGTVSFQMKRPRSTSIPPVDDDRRRMERRMSTTPPPTAR